MKVFLDMDGVLVDFRRGIFDAFNKPCPYEAASRLWTFWEEWSPKPTFEMIDTVCTSKFWRNLRFMHDGLDIFDTVSDKFPDKDIYLLTTPMPNKGSWPGKVEWVQRYFSTFRKRLIITQASKSLFAGPDTLLIDDKDENIEEFIAVGGRGLLVPRPWNKTRFCAGRTLDVVKQFLKDL